MWHLAAKTSDLAEGGAQTLKISEETIALFRVDGKFYAVQNRCLHRGGPLADGHVESGVVTCPWHGWEFDVKTAECRTMQGAKLKKYNTKVEKDEIYIEI